MKSLALATVIFATSCGYSARDNELVGQVKKVVFETPIICADYVHADISLGVLRNGGGSTSKEDVDVYVPNDADIATLKRAAESGEPVKISYDIKRTSWCVSDHHVTSVTILEPEKK